MLLLLWLCFVFTYAIDERVEMRLRKVALAMWRNVEVPVNEERVEAVKRGARPPPSKCPKKPNKPEWTRRDLLACFDIIADANCDKALSAQEIDDARAIHLTYMERFLAWYSVSTETVMHWCDTNKDGKISHQEFLDDYEHCLENDADMCHISEICDRELKKTSSHCPK